MWDDTLEEGFMMKLSFTGKVMLVYGSILVLIISLTFCFFYLGTVGGLQKQLRETNAALLKQIDQRIEMAFRQVEKDLLAMTNDLEFVYFMNDSYIDDAEKKANFFGLNTKLSNFMSNNSQFSSIFVYSDVSGDILTERTFMNKEMSENKWLISYLGMEGYFQWLPTHRIWDGVGNHDVITLIRSYPALSAPGYRTGLLAVNMTEDVLYQMIHDIYEEDYTGHTFIIDSTGQVVTHDDKSMLYSNVRDQSLVKKILSGQESGSFNMRIDGVKQTVFYKTSPYVGWKIVSVVPESQVYKGLTVTRYVLMGLAAGMFMIAFVIVFFISRRTFRPIDILMGKLSGKYRSGGQNREASGRYTGLSYLETVFEQLFVNQEQLETQVREAKPVLKWRIIMDMLTGYRSNYPSVRHQLEYTGVHLYPEQFVVCTAEIEKEGGMNGKDEALYTYALCNVAEEIINMENAGAAIDLGGGHAAILFSFGDGDEVRNSLRAIALLEHILDVMKRQIGLNVTAGIGRCYKEMKQVSLSYEESRQALGYKMVTGTHTVISIEDIQIPGTQDYYRMVQRIDRILYELKETDLGQMRSLLRETFEEAVRGNLPPDLIRQFSLELIMRSIQTVESTGIETEEIMAEIGNVHERIKQCENWTQTEQLVDELLEKMARVIQARRNQRGGSSTIEKIRRYVRENYHDSELSLEKLADEFHLNPTYISKQFKEYTNGNFIDELIEIRIQASKELLKDKNLKVGDISNAVGYTNSRSFMRAFKRYAGLTPTEYRERILGQD
ncbi:MAG: hypothetical protein K0R57_2741 [Paenibacillaceae bacterium]|nr:hypothetical protein [Paenibacillaceae bacterium]